MLKNSARRCGGAVPVEAHIRVLDIPVVQLPVEAHIRVLDIPVVQLPVEAHIRVLDIFAGQSSVAVCVHSQPVVLSLLAACGIYSTFQSRAQRFRAQVLLRIGYSERGA